MEDQKLLTEFMNWFYGANSNASQSWKREKVQMFMDHKKIADQCSLETFEPDFIVIKNKYSTCKFCGRFENQHVSKF